MRLIIVETYKSETNNSRDNQKNEFNVLFQNVKKIKMSNFHDEKSFKLHLTGH